MCEVWDSNIRSIAERWWVFFPCEPVINNCISNSIYAIIICKRNRWKLKNGSKIWEIFWSYRLLKNCRRMRIWRRSIRLVLKSMIFMIRLCLKIRNEEKILYRNIRRPGFRQEARCMGRSMMCRCLVTTHRSARSQNFVCDRAWRLPKNFRWKGLYSTQIGIRCFLILYMMIRWLTAPVH